MSQVGDTIQCLVGGHISLGTITSRNNDGTVEVSCPGSFPSTFTAEAILVYRAVPQKPSCPTITPPERTSHGTSPATTTTT